MSEPVTPETVPIPEPPALPLLGHVRELDPEFPHGSLLRLSRTHGEIYRLRFPNRTVVVLSTNALVNEACDEKRFKKTISAALNQVRNGVHDGLFTAHDGEENWGIAHRILMPAFGPLSIQGMFPEMHDIATQLALKWARYGPDESIAVTDDFTRLTLDTLALCSMGYRFNSYYSPVLHPFIEAMGDFLTECGKRAQRLPLPSLLYRAQDQKYETDIEVLRKTAKGVLESRKAGSRDRKDLLASMLNGVDPKTGKHMTDDSIMDNLITFLIAGHETTSGLLSFAMYQLLKNPDAYAKAQQEVDSVVGKGAITVDHLSRLPYMNGVLRESLRLNSPISSFAVEAIEDDTLLGGKYLVKTGETIVNFLGAAHLDPKVFGDDAEEFRPERMLDDEFNRLNREHPNCWKPFGNGMRGCIGRPFAWQEALLVMAMMLQNFNFVMDPGYNMPLKQTLTLKPKDMRFRAILRDGLDPTSLESRLAGTDSARNGAKKGAGADGEGGSDAVPLTILYGSNSGTCEALAQRLASDAPTHGFRAAKVDCLDSGKGALPTDHPVVIVTSSYEGQPPDNAGHFVAWLEEEKSKAGSGTGTSLAGVNYAVFGCGHKDWVQTFHRVPRLVDTALEGAGANRIVPAGLSDVSAGTTLTDFETWEDEGLWPALKEKYSVSAAGVGAEGAKQGAGMKVEVQSPRTSALRQDVEDATVVEARTLSEGGAEKRHIEIKLPEGTTYEAGDYLAVLPLNPEKTIHRVMRRLEIPRDANLSISSSGHTSLPVDVSVPATHVFGAYVELAQPATKRNILTLADRAQDAETKAAMVAMTEDGGFAEVTAKRTSILDLLERFPSVSMDIGTFLSMLPPMRVRQYSISSSPLWNPGHVTLTYSLLDTPSYSGGAENFQGVTTTYLSTLGKGDRLNVAVRHSQALFGLPADPEETPIICVAAGTGIAPFRGFVQERAAMIDGGRKLAPAVLYFGCRSGADDLYREEFDAWEAQGAVEVRRVYSQSRAENGEGKEWRHVQDRLWEERGDVIPLWRKGARVFVCGSRGVADGVRETIIKMRREDVAEKGSDEDEEGTRKWFESLRNTRYVTDVFD
ncbi:probable bifunctional P-450:NADPH-P450 reductase [Cephalotrichum gorgonifer]|uniref:Bifunctional cytochrome P450/NADPH--P450 reductase n=1 Tax=Cephalotrichum gorgonifer TaxID=2041049 RepID=A0AAE8N7W4_9PEZI|nr:probable bifunctional P-450:NADPH-P450 reductase [Cephalotrichum gorgonifer]